MVISLRRVAAVIFALLPVVGEAVRRKSRRDQLEIGWRKRTSKSFEDIAQSMANEGCRWGYRKGQCEGLGCAFRPLPLDKKPSRSCRRKDEYVLSQKPTARAKALDVQVGLLTEQALKFSTDCPTKSYMRRHPKRSLRCSRSSGHMLRASEFLVKAEKHHAEQGKSGKAVSTAQQRQISKALRGLAGKFGDDGSYIMELAHKAANDAVNISKDPEQRIGLYADSVHKLLMGNEVEKKFARGSIRTLRPSGSKLSKSDRDEAARVASQLQSQYKEGSPKSLQRIDSLANVAPGSSSSSSSLIQVDLEFIITGTLLTLGIILLVIILLLALPVALPVIVPFLVNVLFVKVGAALGAGLLTAGVGVALASAGGAVAGAGGAGIAAGGLAAGGAAVGAGGLAAGGGAAMLPLLAAGALR